MTPEAYADAVYKEAEMGGLPSSDLLYADCLARFSESEHRIVIDSLKTRADKLRLHDVDVAKTLSDYMLLYSRTTKSIYGEGISRLSLGNCASSVGEYECAWTYFDQAAVCFRDCGYDLGWARTCISRLLVCANVNMADAVLADVEASRRVLNDCAEYDYLARLDVNLAWFHNQRGEYDRALTYIQQALELADEHAELAERYRGQMLLVNAYSLGQTGKAQLAIDAYFSAAEFACEREQAVIEINARISASYYRLLQGRYRQALRELYTLKTRVSPNELPVEYLNTQLIIFQAWLELNRHADIMRQWTSFMSELDMLDSWMEVGRAYRYFGIACIYLGRATDALEMLNTAIDAFSELQNQDEIHVTQYWVARTLYELGDIPGTEAALSKWLLDARTENSRLEHEQARLLQARLYLLVGDPDRALVLARNVLHDARHNTLVLLEYQAMHLLGDILDNKEDYPGAIAVYEQSLDLVESFHQHLTVGLYPDFLRDKVGILRALVRLYRDAGHDQQACQTLIRGRAHALAQYIEQHDNLQWRLHTTEARELLAARTDVVGQYNVLFRQVYDPAISLDDASQIAVHDRLRTLEQQLGNLSEQLQLHATDAVLMTGQIPTLDDIQASLPDDAVILQYYVGDESWSVFVIRNRSLRVVDLHVDPQALLTSVSEVRTNIDYSTTISPESPVQITLARQLLPELQALYQILIAALNEGDPHWIRPKDHLYVVPFADLHQLPFSLLYDGVQYLVEKHEISVLPSVASLLGSKPSTSNDVVILGHSWNSQLPKCLVEAASIHQRIGGKLYLEEEATQACLDRSGGLILHIAAHGLFRSDRPELSHILLDDGQLLLDDLMQYNLCYRLIVLTACETGRGRVSGIDELIGVGRGFLLKGAQALLLSLWQIHDHTTQEIMEHFYDWLLAGDRKSQALQRAQQTFMQAHPTFHPASWGALQIIGDPSAIYAR